MERYLAHHGILGMKWGVRRYQNPDGTLTKRGRERLQKYKERRGTVDNSKWRWSDEEREDLEKSGIVVGDKKDIIKKGSTINRIANSGEPIDEKRKYVSLTERDKSQYESMWDAIGVHFDEPISTYQYKALKDISVARYDTVYNHLMQNYATTRLKNIKNVLDEFGEIKNEYTGKNSFEFDLMEQNRKELNHDLHRIFEKKLESIQKEMKEQGYDAMVDLMDARGFAEYPVVLINPKESIKLSKEEHWRL